MGDKLTLKEMAERFNVQPKTFARDVKVKGIPHIVIGKRKRFDLEKVEAFLSHIEIQNKVVKVKPDSRRTVRSRFAEEVGL